MDIAHIKTFLEIYRIRHFGKAAEKLFITQSAASARIKLLENQLGVKLFIRDKRSIEPTPAGHRFYKYAEISVSAWEQARQVVALPDSYHESLSIGCVADIWHLFLNKWLINIQTEFPDLALNLRIHQSTSIADLLINGALDIGFVFEPIHVPALYIEEVTSLKLKLYSTKAEETLDEALNGNYIMIDWGASFQFEYAHLFANSDATATMQTNYGVMALDILKGMGGAAYLPEQVAFDDNETLNLNEVRHAPAFQRKLFAVYRKNSNQDKRIGQIVEMIKEKTQNSNS